MLPYLHILIRVEENGSLHALGAFTTKEKQAAYQQAMGLNDNEVRLDFYNGPFNEDIKVVYAGHRRWNMNRYQLAGYLRTEGEAWNSVTQEGFVSVLRVDTTYEAEQELEKEARAHYAKLQKRWHLSSYEDLVAREGADKTRANIKLRFYEDALESFKPKTKRDVRAFYALFVLILLFPLALFSFLRSAPDYGENVESVAWLPDNTSQISYYRSKQVQVYEFRINPRDFKQWAERNGMVVLRLADPYVISRYKAYAPATARSGEAALPPGRLISKEDFESWQDAISKKLETGLIARGGDGAVALYDLENEKAYFEHLTGF